MSTVLNQRLVTAHLAGQVPEWSIEGEELLTFRDGRMGEPATIPAEFTPLLYVADLLEPFARTVD